MTTIGSVITVLKESSAICGSGRRNAKSTSPLMSDLTSEGGDLLLAMRLVSFSFPRKIFKTLGSQSISNPVRNPTASEAWFSLPARFAASLAAPA